MAVARLGLPSKTTRASHGLPPALRALMVAAGRQRPAGTSNPIELPGSSPMCFAFEIAGSFSLCSYITN